MEDLNIEIVFDGKRRYSFTVPLTSIDQIIDEILYEMAEYLRKRGASRYYIKTWMESFRPYLMSLIYECLRNMECKEDECEGESIYENYTDKGKREMKANCTISFTPEERELVEERLAEALGYSIVTETDYEECVRRDNCAYMMLLPVLHRTEIEIILDSLNLRYWYTIYTTRGE